MMERYSVRRTQMEADLQKEHLNAVTDLLNLSVSSILGFTVRRLQITAIIF